MKSTIMCNEVQSLPCTLLDFLRNTLILRHISPYLEVSNLLSLGATSTSFRALIYATPSVFQYLDLSTTNFCYRFHCSQQPGEEEGINGELSSTDEWYARPLRRVFESLQSKNVMHDVRTLILDKLMVPASLLRDILCDEAYNVRILSLRGVKGLGDDKLIQILRYIIRPSRAEGTPRLKALYYFTPDEASADFSAANLLQRMSMPGVTNNPGAQLGAGISSGAFHRQLVQASWHPLNAWYTGTGEVLQLEPVIEAPWASLLQACEGLIAFDVVLCRHESAQSRPDSDPYPRIATISLNGCQNCGSCPEGPLCPGISSEKELPVLAPLPLRSHSLKAAQRLDTNNLPHPKLILRCRQCLKDRWCERCNVWWCESCYTPPSKRYTSQMSASTGGENPGPDIKVHNSLCVSTCLMDEMLNGVGEGGMWG